MPASSHAPNGSDEARPVAPSGSASTAWRVFAVVGSGLAVFGAVGAIVVRLVTQAPFLPDDFGFGRRSWSRS